LILLKDTYADAYLAKLMSELDAGTRFD